MRSRIAGHTVYRQWHVPAVPIKQTHRHRNQERLHLLMLRARTGLHKSHFIGSRSFIVTASHRYTWRAHLAIPMFELREITFVGIRHRQPKIVASHSLTIMTRKIQIHPLDRKSVVEGKSVSVRVDIGGSGKLKKKK